MTAKDRTYDGVCSHLCCPYCRVISPLNYEPIMFSDVDRYKAWHDAMQDKIQALHFDDTLSLVPFHPSINVVGSC